MKGYIRAILLILIALTVAEGKANQDIDVNLNAESGSDCQESLYGFGTLYFIVSGKTEHNCRVRVYLASDLGNEAILFFNRDMDRSQLDRAKPKVEIEKNGKVKGYIYMTPRSSPIMPAEPQASVADLEIPIGELTEIELPFYVAAYKEKDYGKKGKNDLKYKIRDQNIITAKFFIKTWSPEEDGDYKALKERIDSFVNKTREVRFCNNPKHKPGLEEQKKPYVQELDILRADLQDAWERNIGPNDMSSDEKYKSYQQLRIALDGIDLSKDSDCNNHISKFKDRKGSTVSSSHSCAYCNYSAVALSHQMERLYQQIKARRISVAEARRQANEIVNCYDKNAARKKDNNAKAKIDKYSNLIK